MLRGCPLPVSAAPFCGRTSDAPPSSRTERTLRSFDSDLREWCGNAETGCECRLLSPDVGDAGLKFVVGEMERVGEVVPEPGAELVVGGEPEGTSAHAAAVSGKKPPELDHEFLPDDRPSLLSSSAVEEVRGLGAEEGTLAMTERGGRILKIWSSAGGGPYESKGSGIA